MRCRADSHNQIKIRPMFSRFCCLRPFCSFKSSRPIMVFASSPVGLPVVNTLSQSFPASQLSVVTHYSTPKERFLNGVESLCLEKGIKTYQPVRKGQNRKEKEGGWERFQEEVRKDAGGWPELGVVCSFGYMIPAQVVSSFSRGAILTHPSLVPKYRGGSPIFHAIANGETQSGVSFMSISPRKFDEGNILLQVPHELGEHDSYQTVEKDLSNLAARHVLEVINGLESLLPGLDQKDIDVSHLAPELLTSPIVREKRLKVAMPAERVYNWSRALAVPRVSFRGSEIIIGLEKAFREDPEERFSPGQLVLLGRKLFLKCSDRLIQLREWQEPTKRPLPMHTFINRFIPDRKAYSNDLFFV